MKFQILVLSVSTFLLSTTCTTKSKISDWANLQRFVIDNQKITMVKNDQRVVFMGDSTTEGWLFHDLTFFDNSNYINRGIGGQTTPQMLVRFRSDVIDLEPAVVVILAGINDIAGNTGPMTLEQTAANIKSMAELAKANSIKVILCSVLPAYNFPWNSQPSPANKVIQLNQMIKKFADENDFVYLDYFSAMVDERNGLSKELSNDEVHPTAKGYKVMEPLALAAIQKALE